MEYGFIFDMDGVVIDSNPYHKIAWEKFLTKQGYPYDDQLFDNLLSGRTGPTSLRLLFGDDLPEKQLNLFLEEVDLNYQNILRQTKEVRPIAGLYAFLDQITGNGHRLALATSAPTLNIELGLQKLKLENTFEHIVGKVDVSHGKPHPEVYLTTVERLGIPLENCIVFEDSRAGIQSARNAGLPVVGIASGHSQEELLKEGVAMAVDDFIGLELEKVLELIRQN
ncbi:MAG: HAD family phosphatase [Bacteroidales bacterium]|nr:HAD family phosphatase [Bacteroidales bacterium]